MLPIVVDDPDLTDLPREQLEAMRAAGQRMRKNERRLAASGTDLVRDIIKHPEGFYQWDHYPEGDVYDWESHSQYFYHAHAPGQREDLYGEEHGHFHTFLRPRGFPPDIQPAPIADPAPCAGDNDALTHLVAVSMDMSAQPTRLFTTNRWVTAEYWYTAADVKQVLPRFRINQAYPSLPVNSWLTQLLVLFRPTIEKLIDARDEKIVDAVNKLGKDDVFDHRELELTSVAEISVEAQMQSIETALDQSDRSGGSRQTG